MTKILTNNIISIYTSVLKCNTAFCGSQSIRRSFYLIESFFPIFSRFSSSSFRRYSHQYLFQYSFVPHSLFMSLPYCCALISYEGLGGKNYLVQKSQFCKIWKRSIVLSPVNSPSFILSTLNWVSNFLFSRLVLLSG